METPNAREVVEKESLEKFVGTIPAGQEWVVKNLSRSVITISSGAKLVVTESASRNVFTKEEGGEIQITGEDSRNTIEEKSIDIAPTEDTDISPKYENVSPISAEESKNHDELVMLSRKHLFELLTIDPEKLAGLEKVAVVVKELDNHTYQTYLRLNNLVAQKIIDQATRDVLAKKAQDFFNETVATAYDGSKTPTEELINLLKGDGEYKKYTKLEVELEFRRVASTFIETGNIPQTYLNLDEYDKEALGLIRKNVGHILKE
jgi:hypothetical protein